MAPNISHWIAPETLSLSQKKAQVSVWVELGKYGQKRKTVVIRKRKTVVIASDPIWRHYPAAPLLLGDDNSDIFLH